MHAKTLLTQAMALLLAALPWPALAAVACNAQASIDVRAIQQQVILVGEAHGNEQAPGFVGGLVCSLLKAGRPVLLALERRSDEQAALNRYLASSGSAEHRQTLLRSGAWAWEIQDGRSSQAMLALLEQLRSLRGAGQPVAVLAMARDLEVTLPPTSVSRPGFSEADLQLLGRLNERSMADALAGFATAHRDYTVVALAGSLHTATRAPEGAAPGHQPMGQVLSSLMPVFVIGLHSAEGGQSWNCYSPTDCAAHEWPAGPLYQPGNQIDAVVQLGRLSASPPAARAAGAGVKASPAHQAR